jgi:DUF2075 family protein
MHNKFAIKIKKLLDIAHRTNFNYKHDVSDTTLFPSWGKACSAGQYLWRWGLAASFRLNWVGFAWGRRDISASETSC